MKIEKFISQEKLQLTYKSVSRNPHMPGSESMFNYHVTLSGNGRMMTTPFSKGQGHKGAPPTIDEVLECLASDAGLIENSRNFDEFCSEIGAEIESDEDRRRELKSYKQCKAQTERLKIFLGQDAYETLLWKVKEE